MGAKTNTTRSQARTLSSLRLLSMLASSLVVFVSFLYYYFVETAGTPIWKERHQVLYFANTTMVRGANNCAWLMRNWKENCGKKCVGTYCGQHNFQLKRRMKIPAPCRSCGVGVLCDYRLCLSCGGRTVKQRLIRKRKKAKKHFELVLQELLSAN